MQYKYEYMIQCVYIDDDTDTDNVDCYVNFYKNIIDAMAVYNKQLNSLYEDYIYDPVPDDISTRIVTLYELKNVSVGERSYDIKKKKIRQAVGRIGDVSDSITE